jgi:hypothetical protein
MTRASVYAVALRFWRGDGRGPWELGLKKPEHEALETAAFALDFRGEFVSKATRKFAHHRAEVSQLFASPILVHEHILGTTALWNMYGTKPIVRRQLLSCFQA